MQGFNLSFLWIIFTAGFLTFLVIVGNFLGLGLHRFPGEPRRYTLVGNSQQGRVALEQYGCGSCHRIPGVREARGRVGPSLERVDEQIYLAGLLPNNPDNLMRWIMDPQSIDPNTLMPDLNVSRSEAEDMAAYLYDQPRTAWQRLVREMQYLSSENIP
jgi:cytochrome c2